MPQRPTTDEMWEAVLTGNVRGLNRWRSCESTLDAWVLTRERAAVAA